MAECVWEMECQFQATWLRRRVGAGQGAWREPCDQTRRVELIRDDQSACEATTGEI